MRGFMLALLPTRHKMALLLALASYVHFHTPALAGDYPDRAVKIIVPFPAGGTADAVPRIVADWLSRKWSQPVIIENRTGAAGNICTEDLAFMCEEMGVATGIDLDALAECARMAESIVGHPLPGKLMRGGTLDRWRQLRH